MLNGFEIIKDNETQELLNLLKVDNVPVILVYVSGKLTSEEPTEYAENMYNMTYVAGKIEANFNNVYTYNPSQMIIQGLTSGVFDSNTRYLQKGLSFLEMCDVMVVLPDSQESFGTNVEIEHADAWNIPTIFLDEEYNLTGLKMCVERLIEEDKSECLNV